MPAIAALPSLSCTSSAQGSDIIRNEGTTEQTFDFIFSCINVGNPTMATVSVALTSVGSPLTVTSELLNSSNGITEAALIETDSTGRQATQTFLGTITGNTVTFSNVSIPTSSTNSGFVPFIFTITNIRVDATPLTPGAPVTETVSISGTPVTGGNFEAAQTALVESGLGPQSVTNAVNFPACNAFTAANPAFNLNFGENMLDPLAFKTQVGLNNSTLGWWLTSNTETGYTVQTMVGNNPVGNTSTSGTRVRVIFNNIPANVKIYVPLSPASNQKNSDSVALGTLSLTAAETGAYSAVGASANPTGYTGAASLAQLTVSNGMAEAVYEVTRNSPSTSETYTVPVYMVSAGTVTAQPGAVTATVSFAPVASPAYLPNFALQADTTVVSGSQFPACLLITNTFLGNGEGVLGIGYSQQVVTSGGAAPLAFSVLTGSLPLGLNLDPAAGTVTGTPSGKMAGTYYFTVKVTDSSGQSATQAYTVQIVPAVYIGASSFPTGAVNESYTGSVQALDGFGSYTWSIVSGSLPPGVTLNTANGAITGSATTAGTYNFTVKVLDSSTSSAQSAFAITINPPLAITTTSITTGVVGYTIPTVLAASGGTGGYTWSLTSGAAALSAVGITFSAGGQFQGPATGSTAGINITVQLADPATSVTKNLTVVINPVLSIPTPALPNGIVGVPYSFTETINTGYLPSNCLYYSGTSPGGVNPTGALTLSGTPTLQGTYNFTIRCGDFYSETAYGSFSLTVNPALSITTSSLPAGFTTVAYSQQVMAAGGTGTGYSFSVSAGSLPGGLTLDAPSGTISGTPTAVGPNSFTIKVTDSGSGSATKVYSVPIYAPLTITTTVLPGGAVGVAYNTQLMATGGSGGNTWSVTSGTPPANITLNTSTGLLSGTPAALGSTPLTIKVTDSNGDTASISSTLQIYPQLTLDFVDAVTATSPLAYFRLNAAGGTDQTGNYTYSDSAMGTSVTTPGAPITGSLVKYTSFDGVSGAVTTNLSGGITTAASLMAWVNLSALPSSQSSFTYVAGESQSGNDFDLQFTQTNALGWYTTNGGAYLSYTPNPLTLVGQWHMIVVTFDNTAGKRAIYWDGNLVASDTTQSIPTKTTAFQIGNSSVFPGRNFPGGIEEVAIWNYALTQAQVTQLRNLGTFLPPAVNGVSYGPVSISANGGSGSSTYSANTLPAGLTMSGAGVITGMPTGSGTTAPITVTATDTSSSQQVMQNFSATVYLPVTIPTNITTALTMGSPFTQTLTAQNGYGGQYYWTVSSGTLPPGINLAGATGVLSGTPTTVGSYPLTIGVTDGAGLTGSKTVTFTVAAPPPTITTSSLPAADQGSIYNQTVMATGGSGNYMWSISAGALPPSTGINPSTGAISGAPSSTGTYHFTVKVTDAMSNFATQSLSIVVNPQLSYTVATLPTGTVGIAYNHSFVGSGGSGSYTYNLTSSLPAGLTLNSSTGAVTGTPTAAGNTYVVLNLVDSLGNSNTTSFHMIVDPALAISTTLLPAGQQSTAYSATLSATGGSGTGYTFSTASSLPTGVTLSAAGVFSGTPGSNGAYPLTIQVTDSIGAMQSASLTLVVSVAGTVLSANLPANTVIVNTSGTQYGAQYSSGNNQDYWAGPFATSGPLLEYTIQPGTYTFRAINPTDAAAIYPSLTSPQLNNIFTAWTYNSPYITDLLVFDSSAVGSSSINQLFTVANGLPLIYSAAAAYSASVSGGFYNKIHIGPRSAPGVYTYTFASPETLVFAVPDYGLGDNAGGVSVLISPVFPNLSITTAMSLGNATVGSPYIATLAPTGGSGKYVWTAAGLPAFLTLSPAGVLSGTPAGGDIGSPNFTATVTDPVSGATATKSFSLTVAPTPLTINVITPALGVQGASYSQAFSTSGGFGSVTWTLASGSPPGGLTLGTNGTIAGVPTAAGQFTFIVMAVDQASDMAMQQFTIQVNPPLSITTTTLPAATMGTAYNQTVAATGGAGSYSWSILSGTLINAGFALNPSTGAITGTPVTSNTLTFILQVSDTNGDVANQTFQLSINTQTTSSFNFAVAAGGSSILQVAANGSQTNTICSGAQCHATDLTSDSQGNIYAHDSSGIAAITVGGTVTQVIAFSGNPLFSGGAGTGGLALDGLGNIIFVDNVEDAVYRVSTTGTNLTKVAAFPVQSPSQMQDTYVAIDHNGNYIVVSDDNEAVKVYRFSPSGAPSTLATLPGKTSSGVAVDLPGNIVFLDYANYALVIVSDGGSAVLTQGQALCCNLKGLTYDPPSGSFIADLTSGSLLRVTPAGAITTILTGGSLTNATSVTDIPVLAPPVINQSSLQGGIAGSSYGPVTLTASGGSGSYAWSSTTLPSNLSISASGTISGIPTAAGTSQVTIKVTDTISQFTATLNFSLTILPALSISTLNLPGGFTGSAYSQQLMATGGTSTGYMWSVTAGNLPAGLSLNPSNGLIAGMPTTPGSSTFTVAVIDSGSNMASRQYTVAIITPLNISTTSLPTGVVGFNYSKQLISTGGTGGNTWTVSSGSLPANLSLNASTGLISGIPLATASVPLSLKVTDSNNDTATVNTNLAIVGPISITTTSLPSGVVGTPYNQTIAVTGGVAPLSFSITSGSLASPLVLNPATGAITGTPSGAATSNFTVTVTDASGVADQAVGSFGLTVNLPLSIMTATLPGAQMGSNYSQNVIAAGGSGSYTWSISSGSLPTGASLNTSTGAIAGSLSAVGTFNFTLKVTDTNNSTATNSYSVTVYAPLNITTSNLPAGVAGFSYSKQLAATGGSGGNVWSITSGALPANLSLNASSGAITGTPSASGSTPLTFKVTDSNNDTATVSLTLTIAAPIAITTTTLPGGTTGVAYSQTIAVTGGVAPLSFSITSGSLPSPLTLNSATGAITGTPTASATSTFTVTVSDASGTADQATQAYSIAITPPLSITTTSLAPGVAGFAYSKQLTATGGTGGNVWSITSGALPANLSLNASTGAITGTPSAAGSTPLTFKVTDSNNDTATVSLTLTIAAPIAITTTTLPGGTTGVAYSQTIAVTGGVAPLTFSITSGSLASPLTLNTSTGAITGTPTASATSTFTVTVSDASGTADQATQVYSIAITPPLSITTTSLAPGVAGFAYNKQLTATGGTGGNVWSITSGALPANLSLNASTGAITGTPSASGSTPLTFKVTDSNNDTATVSLTLTIAAPIAITTTTLPGGTTGVAYNQTIAVTGGVAPLSFSITSGSLASPLTLNSATGAITGTPTASATSTFTVTVSDASGTADQATQAYSIAITPPLSITTTSLAPGVAGFAYSKQLTATGGTGGNVWSMTSGALPANLSLNASTGAITGTPSAAGSTPLTFKVTDSNNDTATVSLTLTIAAPIAITTTTLPGGTTGVAYSQTIAATGGVAPLSFSITSGSLASPLTLNSATGAITGTPTASATSTFTVTVSDASGTADQVTQAYSIAITPPLSITTTSLAPGVAGFAYNKQLTATGGTGGNVWSITSGALPANLSLNASTGAITGTPSAAGSTPLTFKVTDSNNDTATVSLTLTIAAPIAITTTTLPGGTTGVAYNQTIAATGGVAPLSFSITSGSLASPLTLNSVTGAITGTPTAVSTSNFTVTVTDSSGLADQAVQSYSVGIFSTLSITTTSLPGADQGSAYSQTVAAAGGSGSYSWSISAGSLPPSTTLNPATGILSGTPSLAGTYVFTVKVSDQAGDSATGQFTVQVNPPLSLTTTTLPAATMGTAYNQTLAVSGGANPYTWSVTQGSFSNAGFALNAATGAITGTPATSGTLAFTVQVADVLGNTATQSFNLPINLQTTSAFDFAVAESGPAILRVSADGTRTNVICAGALCGGPIAADAQGNLYAHNGAGIAKITPAGNATQIVTFSGSPLFAGGAGGGGLALDGLGNIIFVDNVQDAVYRVGVGGTGLAMVAPFPILSPGVAQNTYVALDHSGNYIVVSDDGGAVKIYSFTPAGAAATIATLPGTGSSGVAVDAAGNIVFLDSVNNDVVSVSPQGVATVQAHALTARAAPNGPTLCCGLAGLTIDQTNGSYIADETSSNSLVRVTPAGATTTILAGSPLNGPQSVAQIPVLTPPVISQTPLPAGVAGQAYGPVTLTATGGSGAFTWSATGLPATLILSPAGVLTGNSATATTYTVTITVTDTMSQLAGHATLSLVIAPAPTPPPPSVPPLSISQSTSFIDVGVNAPVSATFTANGGTSPYTFTATGLPPGVTLSSAGALSGASPQAGNFNASVQLVDRNGLTVSASITIDVLGLLSGTLSNGVAGQFYSATLSAAGGAQPYSFTVNGLPTGLSLTSGGSLTGTVRAANTYTFTVTVSDSGGAHVSGSVSVTFTAPQAVTITNATLPGGTVNTPYSQSFTATGGFSPYTWAVSSGSTPPGLSLSSTGTLSGSPTMAGPFSFGVMATDSTGAIATATAGVAILPLPLTVTTQSLPSGVSGLDYPQTQLSVTGGVAPYTWAVTSGSLPSGLTLSTAGVLSGMPGAAGPFPITVTVTDHAGTMGTANLSLTIRPPLPDLILSTSSLGFTVLSPATVAPPSQQIAVQSTQSSQQIAYSVSVSPAAPWLTLSNGASTPDTVQVSLSQAALTLPAGSYQTTLSHRCSSGSCVGNTQNVSVTLNVQATPPRLGVVTDVLSFGTNTTVTQAITQPISVQNTGGGALGFSGVSCAAPWCSAGGAPSTLAGGATASIPITINPALLTAGFFRTQVDIRSSAGNASVPVTVLIASASTMTLAPTGQQFTMQAGGAPGNPSGFFLVSVVSGSSVNWNASVVSGSPWLSLTTGGGTASTSSPGNVGFSINQAAAALLAPGAYYGVIEVSSSGIVNSPQDFEVVLSVSAASTPVVPDAEPAGLLFITSVGGAPPPQTVTVYSGATMPSGFQANATTNSGGAWLAVNPKTGATSSGSAGVTMVSVDTSGLQQGVYTGSVNYSLSATAVRAVNVTLIVAPAGTIGQAVSGVAPSAVAPNGLTPRANCTPSALVPVQVGLVNNFSAAVAWPVPLSIQLANDCGSLITSGQMVATFSNGDPPLPLTLADTVKGIYSGTWTPRSATPQMTVVAHASAPGYPNATAQVAGATVPNAAPVLTPHGTLHSFDPLVGAALAPGTIIQIYGQHLATGTAQPTSIPLPTTMNGTQVLIGGTPAPLYFVSPGQINAQLPFELVSGNQYQVLVTLNGALTTPDSITLTPAAPGLAAFSDGTLIAQHGDGSLVSKTAPAIPGEYLVAYLAGMGDTNATPASGTASPSSPLALPDVPPTLTINGAPAPIAFAGLTPGLVGLYQMNFLVPAGLPAGTITVVVSQSGAPSNQTVLPYQP
jgi:hypothetical protein